MVAVKWELLPEGLWTHPAEYADIDNYHVQAYTECGLPTLEVGRYIGKTEGRNIWINVAKGTADSFDSAKDAAIYEMQRDKLRHNAEQGHL